MPVCIVWEESRCATEMPLCKVCIAGVDKKIVICPSGCENNANVSNASSKCTKNEIVCINNSLEICATSVDKRFELCVNGCVSGASKCNVTPKYTKNEIICLGNQLEVCEIGFDKTYQSCVNGCVNDTSKCSDLPADGKCQAGITYTDGQATPIGFKWCCDRSKPNKAWTSTKSGTLRYSDCVDACTLAPFDPSRISCVFPPLTSVTCDPSKELSYVEGNPKPIGFTWCGDSKTSKKAWFFVGAPGYETLEHTNC